MNQYIGLAEQRLKKEKNIQKRAITTATRKNGYQYYFIENGKRCYVKTQNLGEVQKIIQKDYDESVYNVICKAKKNIERFLNNYDISAIDRVYEGLGEARKRFVVPLRKTDEQYIEEWYETCVGAQNTFPEQGKYITERGEMVRSKSEKIIADLFDKYGIPYSYEPQLKMKSGHYLYPDFALLNVKKRETVYWEHFGLITDPDYAIKALNKINEYEENGLIIGKDILFTMESPSAPLDIKQVEEKIQRIIQGD